MKFTPHEYQRTAMAWLRDKGRSCLFMGMGLGKSVVTLTAFADMKMHLEADRLLVVAPLKVAESTWGGEAAKWDHLRWLSVALCIGDVKHRRAALAQGADVTVVARDTMPWLIDELDGEWPFDMIAIDELTSFKNSKSKRFKAMLKASSMASVVVGLTGTPAPNGLCDLWAQLAVVDLGKALGQKERVFHAKWFKEIKHPTQHIVMKRIPLPGAAEDINDALAGTCLAMEAKDYLDLPPMIVEDLWLDLGPALDKYKDMERDQVLEFAAAGETATAYAASAAALCNKLSQLANGFIYDEAKIAHDLHSAKVDAVAELWESARAEGSGLLVFANYVEDITRVVAKLSAIGAKARRYEGAADMEAWLSGDCDALVCHPASTAYGLNLQGGGWHIAWIGTGWNLEHYQQANARLHRQGQGHPVVVHRLLAKCTIDARMVAAMEGKQGVQQAMMDAVKALREEYGE